MRRSLAFTLLAFATVASAQTRTTNPANPTVPQPTGTVSGHVFCADTNEPARFAHVSLEPIPDPPPLSKSAAAAKPPAPKSQGASVTVTTVETTLDGSFSLTKVLPGNYYVVVVKDGYISPRTMFTQKEIDDPTPEVRQLIAAALPRVHVDGGETEQAEVRLEHGAAISGTILYDDGSPAGEITVKILHKDASGKWVPLPENANIFPRDIETDDRGYYRIPSLLPDEYMVQADLSLVDEITSTNGDGGHGMAVYNRFWLLFYGSGVARLKDATSVKVGSGQEVTDQDMTIPIAKLHRLTGHVAAGTDAHFVSAANLSLLTSDDHQKLASATVSRDDGLFSFEFVPDGDYILKVTNARDVVWEPQKPEPGAPVNPFSNQDKERVVKAYGNAEMPLQFDGDMLGITVTVPPDAKPDAKSAGSQ